MKKGKKGKKGFSLMLVIVMLVSMLSITGCGNETKKTETAKGNKEEVKDNSYSSSAEWDMDREYYYQNCSTIKDDVDSTGNEVVF